MEATPGNSPPKRPRAKATAESPATKPARKTLSASRKKKVAEAEPEIVSESLTATDLRSMIETAAFYRASARNFEPGHELEDWLEAERQILALYA